MDPRTAVAADLRSGANSSVRATYAEVVTRDVIVEARRFQYEVGSTHGSDGGRALLVFIDDRSRRPLFTRPVVLCAEALERLDRGMDRVPSGTGKLGDGRPKRSSTRKRFSSSCRPDGRGRNRHRERGPRADGRRASMTSLRGLTTCTSRNISLGR